MAQSRCTTAGARSRRVASDEWGCLTPHFRVFTAAIHLDTVAMCAGELAQTRSGDFVQGCCST